MFVRVTRVKRGHTTYQYAQIVESYRREADGLPAHRVIANLGQVDDITADNLKAAFRASRLGKTLVLPKETAPMLEQQVVLDNLDFLDVAVVLELMRDWRIGGIIDELCPRGNTEAPASCLVEALVVHRCVDPGSKLAAQRWFPRTALAELLALSPAQFNNTRIHRLLEQLEKVEHQLQAKLVERYRVRQPTFAAMFLDLSDTWFVGKGPTLASRGKTKEGLMRRKVGVALLCNEQGYPLRWRVVDGTAYEARVMAEMARELGVEPWAAQTPLVCDRSMGKLEHIGELLETGLHFVTCAVRTQFERYTRKIPYEKLLEMELEPTQQEQQVREAAKLALQAGLHKVDDELFVLDLGLVDPENPQPERLEAVARGDDFNKVALEEARQLREFFDAEPGLSLRGAALRLGQSRTAITNRLALLRLCPELQREILEGRSQSVKLTTLVQLSALPDAALQRKRFYEELERRNGLAPRQRPAARAENTHASCGAPRQVRAVLYFSPRLFIERRLALGERMARARADIAELNAKLSRGGTQRREKDLYAAAVTLLSAQRVASFFEVEIGRNEASRWCVQLREKTSALHRHARYLGFNIVVAHPGLTQEAAELVQLYRSRSAVEADFGVIKSVLELRPVWHRSDVKVRAHVTLCMLALLVERTLRGALRSDCDQSARSALEELSSCHLNRLQPSSEEPALYTVTRCTAAQQALLNTLNLAWLSNDAEIAERLTAR